MSNRNNSAVLYRRSEKSSSIYIPTFVSFNKHLNYSKFSWAALSRVYYLKLINHDSENISIIICCITTFDLHVLVLMTKLFTVCVARVSWISLCTYKMTLWVVFFLNHEQLVTESSVKWWPTYKVVLYTQGSCTV